MGGAAASKENQKSKKETQDQKQRQNKKKNTILSDQGYQKESKLQQKIEDDNQTIGNPVTFFMCTQIQEEISNLEFQFRLKAENDYGNFKQIINKYYYQDISIQDLKNTLVDIQSVIVKNKLFQKFKTQQFFPLYMIQDHENQQVFFEVYLEECYMQFLEYIHRIQEISFTNEKVNEVYKTETFKWLQKLKLDIEEQYQQNKSLVKEYENELYMDEEYEKVSQQDKYKLELNNKYLQYEKNKDIINPNRVYEETYDFMKKLKGINRDDIIYIQNQMANFNSFYNFQGAWGSSYYAFDKNKKVFLQFFQYSNDNSYRRHIEQAKMFQHEFNNVLITPVVQHNYYSKIIIYERGCMDLQTYLKLKKNNLAKKNQKNKDFDKNTPVITIQELYYLMYFMVENFINLFDNNIVFSDIKLNYFQMVPLRDKKTNKIIKNKYIIKFVPDQMAQYYEEIDFYFPQRYTPFHYKQETLDLASKRKLTRQEIFQSQMYSIGKCIQKCIDPLLETRKDFDIDQFFDIYEENFLGSHLAQVIKNMEGYNEEKMTEWYEHFEVVTKDIAYSTHYSGIYASDCLEDEDDVITKFQEQIVKNANTAKVVSEKKSEKLLQFSLKQLQDEIQFYGQFCLYEQQQKSIECLIDHYDQLHNQLDDSEEKKELKSQYQDKIADIYQQMALNLQKQKKVDEAIEYYNDSLDIKQALYGKQDPKLLKTLMAIGKMSYEENFLVNAEEKFKRALYIVQDQFTEKHYLTSPVITKLGKTCQKAQKYNDSIYYFLEALDNKANFFGENHVQLAQDLNNLGQVYEEQGNLNKAIKVYKKSLQILKKHFGEKHPEITKTQTNIADILHQQGLNVEALQIIQENLQITQDFYGDQHVANGRHEFALGLLYRESQRYQESLQYFERARQKYLNYYGEDHKNYIKIVKELNGCKKDIKNEEDLE